MCSWPRSDRARHVLVAHRREALDNDRSRSQRHYVPIAPKNISGFRGPAFGNIGVRFSTFKKALQFPVLYRGIAALPPARTAKTPAQERRAGHLTNNPMARRFAGGALRFTKGRCC